MTDHKPGFADSEAYMLHEIVIRLDRRARTRSLNAHGLTYTEFLVMVAVRELPDPSQSSVADAFDFSASAVSQKVSSLLGKGLLTQRRDDENRRIVRLSLTTAGDELLNKVYGELSACASEVFDTLGDRRPEFHAALTSLLTTLRELGDI